MQYLEQNKLLSQKFFSYLQLHIFKLQDELEGMQWRECQVCRNVKGVFSYC